MCVKFPLSSAGAPRPLRWGTQGHDHGDDHLLGLLPRGKGPKVLPATIQPYHVVCHCGVYLAKSIGYSTTHPAYPPGVAHVRRFVRKCPLTSASLGPGAAGTILPHRGRRATWRRSRPTHDGRSQVRIALLRHLRARAGAPTSPRNADLLSRPSHPGLAEYPKLKSGLPSLRK
jgi:hypothetical protein